MFDRLSSFIVAKRRIIGALFILLTIASVFTINKSVINYDIASYLGKETRTRKGLDIMQSEFGSTNQMTLLLSDAPEGEAASLAERLSLLDGIMRTDFSAEPDTKLYNGISYERIHLYVDSEDPIAYYDVLSSWLAENCSADYLLCGDAADTIELKQDITHGVIVALAIALVIVIGVLFLTSHSYIEPLLFLIVLAVSIAINMGTNFIFPSVSFITFAVAPILQLALAMDYSIMLLHTFFEIRDAGTDDVSAVKLALSRTFMPVLSSSLTTVAGLVSLMFMSFTIGFDIGIVLSKGILISMITVFLLMPSLILLFSRPLRTTMHRPVPLGGPAIGRLAIRCRRVIPVILLGLTAVCCLLQKNVEYTYSNPAFDGKTAIMNEVFGSTDQMVILLPGEQTDEEFDRQRELVSHISELRFGDEPAVLSVSGMVTTAEDVIRYYSPEDVSELLGINKIAVGFYFGALGFNGNVRGDQLVDTAASIMTENEQITNLRDTMNFAKRMFISDHYSRLILLVNVPSFTAEGEGFLSDLEKLLDKYYPEGGTYMAGNLVSRWDISSAFGSDQLTVSLITIFAVFLIVCLSFRSAAIPVLLVCTIQGAVWMNTGMSVLLDEGVFFMCYLICLAIQMGATIDYGILLTSNYRLCRVSANRENSLCEALRLSMPTILTSGLILLFASGIIGIGRLDLFGQSIRVIDVYFIYAIGRMLARGTAFSLGMVLLFLPPALYVCDRFVVGRLPHIDTPNS